MAKRRPIRTLTEIERQLGYGIDLLNYPHDATKRFYVDLGPVPESAHERAEREVEENTKQSLREGNYILERSSIDVGVPQTTIRGPDTVTFTCRSLVGHYNYTADVQFGFGLDLSLMLTKNEAMAAMTAPKLQLDSACRLGPMFSKLSKEIRQQIYDLAIPRGQWTTVDVDNPRCNFPEGIGDLSGFYFPISSLGILTVNKQIRQEALPLAYRSTTFRMDDIDDLIKLLIGIGDIGRDNIDSVEFAWQSKSEIQSQSTEAVISTEQSLTSPSLHVASCIQLLRQCKNLKFLNLFLDSDLISRNNPDTQEIDSGLHALRSVRGIQKLEIYDLAAEPLNHPEFVGWLREAMQSPRQEQDDKAMLGIV